ncbi:MAG: hypothetical protein ACRDO7_00370 [Nocardioidaceae bacterium]
MSSLRKIARKVGIGLVGCALPIAFLQVSSPYASAEPDRPHLVRTLHPDGSDRGTWTVRSTPSAKELVWRADHRIPVTSARPEVRVGHSVVGYPVVGADGRTLTLAGDDLPDTDRLQVWLGSRRLDGPTPPLRTGAVPDVVGAKAVDAGVDPAKPGPHDTESFDYGAAALPWPAYPGDMEVRGQAVLPKGVDDAPLVLFLHGRHQACYGRGDDGTWPCAGASKPVPSHRGYTYLQQRLASQGYATVSVSANAINQQDFSDPDGGARARSALGRHHLRLLATKAAAPGNRWSGRLDLDRVVLVGHSRGGEGVNQAVVDTGASAPYSVVGQFLIAPTDFAQQTAGYMPTVVALPYCDGDVSDLQGQKFVDASVGLADGDTSLRSSVLVRGANHNFFNTEWTPGISAAPSFDDWGSPRDKVCGARASATRLSAAQQRRVALTLTTGAVRMFVRRDPGMLRIFDAPGAITTKSMGEIGVLWSHAVGGARTSVRAGSGATVVGAAEECIAATEIGRPDGLRSCAAGESGYGRAVHWMQPFFGPVSRAALHEARLTWKRAGRSGGLALGEPLDVSATDATIDLRLIGTRDASRVRVELRDADGDAWSRQLRVLRLLGGDFLRPYWAQTVRIDPSRAPDAFDAAAVRSIRVVSDSPDGSAWIVDASARRSKLPAVPDRVLPRLMLGDATVKEGDGPGPGVARVPFRLLGPVTGPSSFDVFTGSRLVRIDVPAGRREGTVRVRYHRNTIDDRDRRAYRLTAQAVDGIALGRYQARLTVRDDDPSPRLRVTPKRKVYVAGQTLRWTARISEPVGFGMTPRIRLSEVEGFAALRGTDVPRRWLAHHGTVENRQRPLSRLVRYLFVRIPEGQREASLRIPTVRRAPGAPQKRIRLTWHSAHHEPRSTIAIVKPASG